MYCDWPQLGRCCFCMPLRRGVLTFGYINVLFSAFLVGMYSYAVHHDRNMGFLFYGNATNLSTEVCVAIYCLEVVFNVILIYGTHKKSIPYIRAYFYFAVTTTVATLVLQIIDFTTYEYIDIVFRMVIFTFTGLCIQLYLLMLVGSLLKKLETDGPHLYDNPLHQIVTGEVKVEANGVYNNTTVDVLDV